MEKRSLLKQENFHNRQAFSKMSVQVLLGAQKFYSNQLSISNEICKSDKSVQFRSMFAHNQLFQRLFWCKHFCSNPKSNAVISLIKNCRTHYANEALSYQPSFLQNTGRYLYSPSFEYFYEGCLNCRKIQNTLNI